MTAIRGRILVTLLCLIATLAAVGLYAFRHFRFPSLAETFPEGELIIGIDAGYPPFGDIVDDAFVGLDVDIGAALAQTLGLRPRYVMVNFDSAYDAVKTGVAHVSLAALRVDPARMADVAYTWGYLNDGLLLVSGHELTSGWALGGQRVAVELGAAGHAEARRWSRRVRDLHVIPFDTPEEALDALEAGHADAAISDAISVRQYLRAAPDAALTAVHLTDAFYAGAVRLDRRDVLHHLNGAMLTLLADGTIERLITLHIGAAP